jgi:hypothetical protein
LIVTLSVVVINLDWSNVFCVGTVVRSLPKFCRSCMPLTSQKERKREERKEIDAG